MPDNPEIPTNEGNSSTSKTYARFQEQNRKIENYHEKWKNYESLKSVFERLIVPNIGNQKENIRDIHVCIDELDSLYLEIGYIGENGKFDLEGYQFVRLDRKIREGKITKLSQVPEDFRETFEDYFTDEAKEIFKEDNDFQKSSDIRELIDEQRCILDEYFYQEYPFYCYLDMDASPNIEVLIDNLNELWDDYKKLVIELAYHF